MYQTSIRNKKQKKIFNNSQNNNYDINNDYEEYAYVKKLLGNCRVSLITNTGNDCLGVIRGNLRKFTHRVLIEKGDIVVVSKRDFQDNKVDIVHKFNREQIQILIKEEKISNVLINYYNNKLTNNDNVEFDISDDIDFEDHYNNNYTNIKDIIDITDSESESEI